MHILSINWPIFVSRARVRTFNEESLQCVIAPVTIISHLGPVSISQCLRRPLPRIHRPIVLVQSFLLVKAHESVSLAFLFHLSNPQYIDGK
jgi:hypothetical protein